MKSKDIDKSYAYKSAASKLKKGGKIIVEKEIKEVRNIKVFGNGRLLNPETGEYFVRFENGEALVSKDEVQTIKKYHPQVRFIGQKEKPVSQPNMKNYVKPKSFNNIKSGFKLPTE